MTKRKVVIPAEAKSPSPVRMLFAYWGDEVKRRDLQVLRTRRRMVMALDDRYFDTLTSTLLPAGTVSSAHVIAFPK